jgi:hypothetical protein
MLSRACKFIIVFILIYCYGCGFEKRDKSNIPTVNLNPNKTQIDCVLSEIGKNAKLISLETNLNCVVGNFSWLVFMDHDNIIYRSDKKILIFDSNGNYLNKIDAVGNGPGEYTTIVGIAIDPIIKNIFILDKDAIKIFHFNGKFMKTIELGYFPSGLYRTIDKQNFVSVSQSYKEINRDMLVLYDSNFKKIKTFKSKNSENLNKIRQDFFFALNPYEVDNKVFYNEPYVDTIFEITNKQLKPHYIIESGEFKMKMTDGLNVENLHKAYEKDKITLPGIMESSKYFFFNYYYKKESCYSVFNKDSKKMILHQKILFENLTNENINFGFKNDLIKEAPDFWPDYIAGNKMVKVLFPYSLTESQRVAFKCKESDNPILMIVTLQ